MELSQEILYYIEQHREEAFHLLLELAQIPAPSHREEKRAEFCRAWLERQGAKGVYIDQALNVVYPIGYEEEKPAVIFMAHSDVVFPDLDPLPLRVEEGKIKCPGVGDDTANVVALLMAAKYIAEHGLAARNCGVVLVINSGEEGLGNLKGCRAVMERFGTQTTEFVTFDGYAEEIVHRAVGSRRYRIEVKTEGGHSYRDFGNRNAIACLASIVNELYSIQVPSAGTTYNVGMIQGGTSVNTIAQQAELLYEFRSDQRNALETMQEQMDCVLDRYLARGLNVTATLIGDRPCSGDVDPRQAEELERRAVAAIKRHYGYQARLASGSTDCNIPLSRGIASVCVGCVEGGGAHTREEYVETDSLYPGLCVAFEMILHHFEKSKE